MSVSIELLDAVKANNGGCSDYRAAKLLGVTQSVTTQIRNHGLNLSPEKAILACQLAGFDAIEWLMKLYHERAKCTAERDVLDRLTARLAA